MANRYANLPGAAKIKDTYDRINQGFDLVEQDVDQLRADLDQEIADREAAVEYVDQRVDNIIVGGGPDKDPELVDIRNLDPSYTPDRTINVAGDVTRDMQAQFVAHKADFGQLVSELAMVKLGEINIVGSSVTEVTFSGLNVDFGESLVLVAQLNYPNSGANDNGIMLTINNVSDNTYYKRQTSIIGATAAHEQANSRTIFVQPAANPAVLLADIGFATNGTGLFDGNNTILVNYRASTADAAKNAINVMGTLLFSRDGYTDSISNIRLRAVQANGLRTGSKFSLYKRK